MVKRKNKEIRKRRKNFLPTLLVIILLWAALVFEIFFIDPSSFGAIPLFFALFFLALLFTLSTLILNTRRGFIISFAALVFVILRYFGVGNIVNFLLLSGIVIAIEVYFTKN
jgi:hypothetical protein